MMVPHLHNTLHENVWWMMPYNDFTQSSGEEMAAKD